MTQGGSDRNTCGRLAASFRAGMITLTVGTMANVGEMGR